VLAVLVECRRPDGAELAPRQRGLEQICGVDCALDCAAREDTSNPAIRAVRNGGRVVLPGIHSAALVPFEVSPRRRKELAICNVRRSCHESHDALHLLTERLAWFAPLVTHTRPLDVLPDAFTLTENYEDGVAKMVITPPAH